MRHHRTIDERCRKSRIVPGIQGDFDFQEYHPAQPLRQASGFVISSDLHPVYRQKLFQCVPYAQPSKPASKVALRPANRELRRSFHWHFAWQNCTASDSRLADVDRPSCFHTVASGKYRLAAAIAARPLAAERV
jgi:hypothetical protein